MENRKRIIELLTAVRYTTNDIEKVADEICSLFNVSQQRELLAFIEEVSAFDALASSTRLRIRAKELLKANCG